MAVASSTVVPAGPGPDRRQKVLELYNYTPEMLRATPEERRKLLQKMTKSSEAGGFGKDSQTGQASITLMQELACMTAMFVCIGGPLMTFYIGTYIFLFGTWTQFVIFGLVSAVLCMHPLPKVQEYLNKSEFSIWLYKYFSYRMMWFDDELDEAFAAQPWMGAAGPHGVLPFASVLSLPAINTVLGMDFKGSSASVVFNVPGLRYMTLMGMTDVKASSMAQELKKGTNVGIVPDGIAGIFKCSREKEVLVIKNRKGLARFCLRNGANIIPCFSVGNTDVFDVWYDPYGICEWVSRKLQTSLMIYWGRFYLPIPRRTPVTLLFAKPILVEKLPEDQITPEVVDELHDRLLASITQLYNSHKKCLGYGHKEFQLL